MPLGIELAAAALRTQSCERIADDIQQSAKRLATTLRNVPEHHRDLYALFSPCWNRLSTEEQAMFMRLSVCWDGFEPEAAEYIAGATRSVLTSLVEKSLLRVAPSGRYEMHELVRQYAAMQLETDSGRATETHTRHCAFYTSWLSAQLDQLRTSAVAPAVNAIQAEIGNANAAWDWAIQQGDWVAIDRALDTLGIYFQIRDCHVLAAGYFCTALDRLGEGNSVLRTRLMAWRTYYDHGMNWSEVHQANREFLKLAQIHGCHVVDPTPLGSFAIRLKWDAQPWYGESRDLFIKALAVHRQRNDIWGIANLLGYIACFHQHEGDLAQARACRLESLKLFREIHSSFGISTLLHGLFDGACIARDFDSVASYARQLYDICQEMGDEGGKAMAQFYLSMSFFAKGDLEKAYPWLAAILETFPPTALLGTRGMMQNFLGATALRTHDLKRARQLFAESLREALKVHRPTNIASALFWVVRLYLVEGRRQQAADAFAWVQSILGEYHHLCPFYSVCEVPETIAAMTADESVMLPAPNAHDSLEDFVTRVIHELEHEESPSKARPYSLLDPLTERELEVLALIIEGYRNREMADRLYIGVSTVKKHINHIFSKLGVDTRARAIARARELDLF